MSAPVDLRDKIKQINKTHEVLHSAESENIAKPIEEQIKDYWTISGTKGDFTAGVAGTLFSLGGFVLIYLSFKKQREANEMQLKFFNEEKIENRFFELIKLYRDNVNEMTFTFLKEHYVIESELPVLKKNEKIATHREVFHIIFEHFKQALGELKFFFDNISIDTIYEDDYYYKFSENNVLQKRRIDPVLYAKIDIIYLIVFFGVGSEGTHTILSLVNGKYCKNFMDKILEFAALKPKVQSMYWERWYLTTKRKNSRQIFENILKKRIDDKLEFDNLKKEKFNFKGKEFFYEPYYESNYEKFYGGHQFRLGHYFRHLFQSVSYINDQESLTSDEQYNYVKHLRGQFSTYEQILFFLNSISQLGRVWELEDKKTAGEIPRHEQLITDYQLIKNIPNDLIALNIKLTDFYPDINFEGFTPIKAIAKE